MLIRSAGELTVELGGLAAEVVLTNPSYRGGGITIGHYKYFGTPWHHCQAIACAI